MLLVEAGAQRAELPGRRLVTTALNTIYDFALNEMHLKLHRAPAFSLAFDGWTGRSLKDAYIAILYGYVDDDLKVRCMRSACRTHP